MTSVSCFQPRFVVAVSLSIIIALIGCGEPMDYDDYPEDVEQIVDDETMTVLEDDLDMAVHQGGAPPELDGSYKISPMVAVESNVPEDSLPHRVTDDYVRFFPVDDGPEGAMDIDALEKDYENDQQVSESVGIGALIRGEGDSFSIFAVVDLENETGETAELLNVYSGKLEEGGIANLEYATVMLDNHGYDDAFINNGQGRKFVDDDGFSEEHPYPGD